MGMEWVANKDMATTSHTADEASTRAFRFWTRPVRVSR